MSGKFILDGHKAIPCGDLLEWGRWLETGNKRVAQDTVGDVRVSTVFLDLDHSFGKGPPLLFETMVFGVDDNEDMERYSTWSEAEAGHARWVEKVRKEEIAARGEGVTPSLAREGKK